MRQIVLVLIAAVVLAGGSGSLLAQSSDSKNSKPGSQSGTTRETEIIILKGEKGAPKPPQKSTTEGTSSGSTGKTR